MTASNASYVLLVEDDADDAFLTRRALTRGGLRSTIELATDGVEALELFDACFATGRALPSVVLLDVRLPRRSGIEVYRALRSRRETAGLPIIVLATGAFDRAPFDASDRNLTFLSKPVSMPAFEAALERLRVRGLLPPARFDVAS